jgi:hypothetical protein
MCGRLMALCHEDITPCLIGAKKVGLVGAIFTSSKHLSAPPWQKSIVRMHRLDLVSRRGGTGTILVAAFAAVAKMSVQCVDDASYTKQPNINDN